MIKQSDTKAPLHKLEKLFRSCTKEMPRNKIALVQPMRKYRDKYSGAKSVFKANHDKRIGPKYPNKNAEP